MNDLEITKLCADAMGLEVYAHAGDSFPGKLVSRGADNRDYPYDPLHDDAQAMALLKKFRPHPDMKKAIDFFMRGGYELALNRAICECVARMMVSSRAMPA